MMRMTGVVVLVALLLAGAYQLGRTQGSAPPKFRSMTLQDFEEGIDRAGVWSGGPDQLRSVTGRLSLAKAIESGLSPDDKFLDIGAGSLRVGWWFLHYLKAENYYAIEPVEERIDTATSLMGVDIHTFHNMDFEFPDVKFDFVFARSIWSHASKSMISKMLSEFVEQAAPDAKFLTSVIFAATADEDYMGDEWVGRIEKDDKGGFARHSKDWVQGECDRLGLSMREVGDQYGQTWLLIEKK